MLLALNVGVTSGTIALGEIGLANQYCGFTLATAAPLSVFTLGTPKNAYLGVGKASAMSFTPSAGTLTAGGTACWWSGYAIESATAGLGVFRAQIDIDGQIVVPPGQLVFLCGSVAQTALFTASLVWAEVDR